MPNSCRSESDKLVSTVTASTSGWAGDWAAASAAAFSILLPPRGVDGHHADAQLGGRLDGRGDGVRDVVELEVEKNLPAGGDQVAHNLRPLGREELFPDLVGSCGLADGLYDLAGLGGARNIERHDEPIPWLQHRLPV